MSPNAKGAALVLSQAASIARRKAMTHFSSAIRIFLMLYYRDAATEAGHAEAEHARILSRVRRRGKRPPGRRPSRRSGGGPDEESYGARRCIETGNPDEWS